MSWQVNTWVELTTITDSNSSLVATGNVDKAAIFNSEGTSVWASSPGFTVCAVPRFREFQDEPARASNLVAPAEIKAVVASFADTSDVKKVQSEGFHIATEKFFTLKSDERSLYGKKGKEGVVAVKTKQAILVAHYPETVQPGAAATTVENLGDYLIGVGY
ncbi:MAG: hypothetical protein Q9209_000932 [Squamulea sp. 1 TL-2023]